MMGLSKKWLVLSSLCSTLLYSSIAQAHSSSSLQEFKTASTVIAKVKFKNYKTGMWKLNQLHLDVAGIDIKNASADVLVNESELKKLEDMGFDVSVIMSKSLMRGPDPQYKNPAEIEKLLHDFNTQFPELTEIKEVGKSLQGRSIWALKITNRKISGSKPSVLFNGMHHAREVMGPEVALDIIETLLRGYGKDNRITHWVDSNQIWVLPMFNVDGNNIVWTNDTMWRKNARDSYGVDINRNYPFAWGSCNGSSAARWAQDYRGPSAASEPETNVMMKLVSEIRPVFDISYHSYSELVIYPMGCDGQRTQNADVVETIGKEMGKSIGYTAGTAWETLYSVDGSDIDWMYSTYQVIPYVIEVNSSRDGFQPDYSKRQPTVELNRKAWQLLLDRLDGSGIRGVVDRASAPIGDFSVLVQKKIGNQYVNYMNYKGNPDGSFHIVTNPGDFRIIISGQNFAAITKDVSVGKNRTELSLSL